MDIRKYTIANVQRRDEWGPVHGSMMQDYAISLEGEEGWIKLTQKVETRPPEVGQELEGYIENKTNTNGTSYRKFKKESSQFAQSGRSAPQQSPTNQKDMDYIILMLEELTGRRDEAAVQTDSSLLEDDPFKDLNI